MKHIVIIGAGFAGLKLARQLNNNKHYKITLIDKNNYHQFQPLLYQVATANLDASNVSFPLRTIFKHSKNVSVRITELKSINTANNTIETDTGTIEFDYLVIATGADTNYFGNDELSKNAFPMKSTLEALQLRNRIIQVFETASICKDELELQKLLTIVVVGGGPTGIELSGALAEIKHEKLPGEYPELNINKVKILLLEGSSGLLSAMREPSSKRSEQYLKNMGVVVKTNTIVKSYDGNQVILTNGETIPSALVIWAAGIKGNVPAGIEQTLVAPGNRIMVDQMNRVEGFTNIFTLGDLAYMKTESHPKALPQLASVAIDQAKNLANNFKNMLANKPLEPYHYVNKGYMATVGQNKAVVDLEFPKWSLGGFLAWFIWMSLHLFLLIGFKNRIVVFIHWIYKYFLRTQSLSLLFEPLLRRRKT